MKFEDDENILFFNNIALTFFQSEYKVKIKIESEK